MRNRLQFTPFSFHDYEDSTQGWPGVPKLFYLWLLLFSYERGGWVRWDSKYLARVSSLDPRTVKKAMECELLQNELIFEQRKAGLFCTHPRVLQTLQGIEQEQERRQMAQQERRNREKSGQPAAQNTAQNGQRFTENEQRFAENEQRFAENEQRFAENEQRFAETCTDAHLNPLKNNENQGQVCAQVVVIKEEKRKENTILSTTLLGGPDFQNFQEFWNSQNLGPEPVAQKCWEYWNRLNWSESKEGQQVLVDWRKKAINWARTERPEQARQTLPQNARQPARQGFNSAAVLGAAVQAIGGVK